MKIKRALIILGAILLVIVITALVGGLGSTTDTDDIKIEDSFGIQTEVSDDNPSKNTDLPDPEAENNETGENEENKNNESESTYSSESYSTSYAGGGSSTYFGVTPTPCPTGDPDPTPTPTPTPSESPDPTPTPSESPSPQPTRTPDPPEEIPEFPTIAIPLAMILGLIFLSSRRKRSA